LSAVLPVSALGAAAGKLDDVLRAGGGGALLLSAGFSDDVIAPGLDPTKRAQWEAYQGKNTARANGQSDTEILAHDR